MPAAHRFFRYSPILDSTHKDPQLYQTMIQDLGLLNTTDF